MIMALPDLHCYWKSFEHEHLGEPSRLREWRACTAKIIDLAESRHVDVAVAPGDFFNSAHPNAAEICAVIEFFQELSEYGVIIIGCSGNHDYPGLGKVGPVEVVGSHNPYWGLTKRCFLPPIKDHVFIVAPWAKSVEIPGSDPIKMLTEVIEGELERSQHQYSDAHRMVLVAHYPTDCSTYVNDQVPGEDEVYLPVEWLHRHFDLAILGHVHKPQILFDGERLALHTGVLTRGKIDEGRIPCGVYIIDSDSMTWEYEEVPARPVVEFRLSCEHVANYETGEWAAAIPDVEDSIVVVRYQATEEQAKIIRHDEIIELLRAAGAYQIEGIYPEIVKQARRRDVTIDQALAPGDALERWLLQKNLSDELRGAVLAEGRSLLAQVCSV